MKKKISLIVISLFLIAISTQQSMSALEYNWKIEFYDVKIHYYFLIDFPLVSNPITIDCPPSAEYGYMTNPDSLDFSVKTIQILWDFLTIIMKNENSIIESVEPKRREDVPAYLIINLKDKTKVKYNGIYLEWIIEESSVLDTYEFHEMQTYGLKYKQVYDLISILSQFKKEHYNIDIKSKCTETISNDIYYGHAYTEITANDIRILNEKGKEICSGINCYDFLKENYKYSVIFEGIKRNEIDKDSEGRIIFYYGDMRFVILNNPENILIGENFGFITVFNEIERNMKIIKSELKDIKSKRDDLYMNLNKTNILELAIIYEDTNQRLLKMEEFLNGSKAYYDRNRLILLMFDRWNIYSTILNDIDNYKKEIQILESHFDFIKDVYFLKTEEKALQYSYNAIITAICIGIISVLIVGGITIYYNKKLSQKNEEEYQKLRKEYEKQSRILQEISETLKEKKDNQKDKNKSLKKSSERSSRIKRKKS